MPGTNDLQNIFLDANEFSAVNWKEAVAGFAPGGGDVFSLENSEAVSVGYIPYNMRGSFVRDVLGISYTETNVILGIYQLHRLAALYHPVYTWMQCHSVHFSYFQPDGSELKLPSQKPGYAFDYAKYQHCQVTLRFKQLPWDYLTDADVSGSGRGEWMRFTYDPDRTGNLDILSQTSGNPLKYAETGPTGPSVGSSFPSQVGLPVYKENFNFMWMYVPKDYIISAVSGSISGYGAFKIIQRLGTVNDATFLGYPAGTLLFAGVKFDRFQWPYKTVGLSAYGYNVTFNFQSFDPTKGNGFSSFRGHNLLPYSGDGKWYYATVDGSTGGTPFLRSSDYTKLFEHIDKP